MPTEHLFVDGALAAADMARRIAMILGDAIAQRGVAAIALSGGRSPRPVLEALAGAALDWDKVIVTLVDERWVEPDHADSNERLVRAALLQRSEERRLGKRGFSKGRSRWSPER